MTSVQERKYVGKPVGKVDALERVTGQAQYGADVYLPGMLYGKVLRSPRPHARIKRIDVSKARQLHGVKAVITAADLPPMPAPGVSFGGELYISLIDLRKMNLAHEKALFDGHAIAAVAAISPEAAEEALGLIEVDYEILPPVENAVDAMRVDAPLIHHDLYTKTLGEQPTKPSNVAMYLEDGRGDLDKAWADADAVIEETYETLMVHQGYLEPQACVARVNPDGTITVWTSNQGIFHVQKQLSALLKLPQDKLTIVPMELGGGFGGKIYTLLEPLALMLAQQSNQPVKMVLDRSEVFRATGPGSPTTITVKVGAKKDGKLTGCYAKMIYDAGALPGAPIGGACLVSFGPYKVDNLRLEAYDVVTNKPRVQAYRAPGGTSMGFAVEQTMDMLAEKLNLDPLEFRKINAVDQGDLMTNNRPLDRVGLKEILKQIESHPSWTTPLEGPNRGRGLALAFWPGGTLLSSSVIYIHVDGTVTVTTGQVDVTGIRTTMTQVVAEELHVPLEDVTVKVVDTSSAPYTDMSSGSRSGWTQSIALYRACQEAIKQMKVHAAKQFFKSEPEEVEYADRKFWVRRDPENSVSWSEVARVSFIRSEGPVMAKGLVNHTPSSSGAIAAHVADVEVDPETGKVKLLKFTCFQDVGTALNPQQVEGQMQGGATQGIGWAMYEYYHYDKGQLRNPSLLDYRMPTALDLPMIDTVIIEVPTEQPPYGARGVGEVPIVPPPAAIANAIYRATGVRLYNLPMTPESVFWAMKGKKSDGHQG